MSDTFRKVVNFPVGIKKTAVASAAADVVNLGEVQALVAGLNLAKEAVAVDTHDNIDLATGGLIVIDGYQTIDGDRVLVREQTDSSQNGIYIASSGAWSRATDADEAAELKAKTSVTVLNGPHSGRKYELQEDQPVVGTDAQTWIVTSASSSAAVDTTVDTTNFDRINPASSNAQSALDSVDDLLVTITDTVDSINGAGAGAQDYGTFTGSTLSDNASGKILFQELETAHEQLVTDLANDRFESTVTTLTTGSTITFTHNIGTQFLSGLKVYNVVEGANEDITHTVTIVAVDGNNVTVQNDGDPVDVVVVCAK
ncbi:virion structural protein [Vibrio phage PVA1]|uniref:virion structural protein n=1 Tax=Vibrio phage PVA1 TaxID=1461743 RepID=UPI0003F1FE96|nr:virion structural protein [Vibrio phage PVA1]AHJ87864.1 tail fiber protein H [Vibrio phage PVA1]